jgi:hypothetical protein
MQKNLFGMVLGSLVCTAVLMPTSAHAYLDPGAGTFALQGLIAGVAGGMVAIRAYWHRTRGLFRRSNRSDEIWPERSLSDGDA